MSFVSRSGLIISIKELRITTRLSKRALKEMSLSKWPSFLGSLQLVQKDVFTGAYSTLGFEPFQNLHMGISMYLKH